MNIKTLEKAMVDIQESRMLSYDVVIGAIKEGLTKACVKHIENLPAYKLVKENNGDKRENRVKREIQVRLETDAKGEIKLYHQRVVTDEEFKDKAINISLTEALNRNANAKVGDVVEDEIKIENFSRSSVMLMKNVMNQQIKEANKTIVYNEYIDKVDDMVIGTVQTVEDKFVLVDLGKTVALLPKSEQVPFENYYDGQKLKVVIKTVSKDPKAAQVVVSRASANLVKRLFEATVTEIFDGTVEIKAIAREAGERTKMAVVSHNSNVDPVAACIGPRGTRVSAVITEITQTNNAKVRENIDIVEWNPNYVEYVKNVMKPATVSGVLPGSDEGKNLLVVVDDNQLSLAIGKRGINARLAVKLLNRKIDIKSRTVVEQEGIDWYNETITYSAKEEAIRKQKSLDELKKQQEALIEASKLVEEETIELVDDIFEETVPQPTVVEPVVEETVETPVVVETVEEESVVEVVKRRKPKLEKVSSSEYVSKYEDLAERKTTEAKKATNKKRKNTKDDEEEAERKKQLEELKNKSYEIMPEYSDEELEAFNDADDDHWYDEDDIDYDEYNEYYDN